jgi:hypothetical protein
MPPQLPWYARVMMSAAHVAAWAYRLPTEWTGTPPVRWSVAVRQRSGHGTFNVEAAHHLSVE